MAEVDNLLISVYKMQIYFFKALVYRCSNMMHLSKLRKSKLLLQLLLEPRIICF